MLIRFKGNIPLFAFNITENIIIGPFEKNKIYNLPDPIAQYLLEKYPDYLEIVEGGE